MRDRHEVLREIIDLYIEPMYSERIIYLWEKKPKRRQQLYDELFHCIDWFRSPLSTDLDPPIADPGRVGQLMRKLGAGKICLVYSIYDYDRPAEDADLDVALREYVGQQRSCLLFCPTSKVAFCEDHNGSQLLLHLKRPADLLKPASAVVSAGGPHHRGHR